MNLELATTQDMNDAIKSIGSFMKYLTEQSGENPDKVFIFLHTLRKATEELEKQAKKASELRQETYWELSGGYSLRLTQKASYDYSDDEECIILEAKLKARKEILKLQYDLEHKKWWSDHKKVSLSYSLISPK